jgi:hypothetical protein
MLPSNVRDPAICTSLCCLEYNCRHDAFRPTNLQQKLYMRECLDTAVEEEGESDDGDEDEEDDDDEEERCVGL